MSIQILVAKTSRDKLDNENVIDNSSLRQSEILPPGDHPERPKCKKYFKEDIS
jgi:hypothetical protein